jgi:hypothetical protein
MNAGPTAELDLNMTYSEACLPHQSTGRDRQSLPLPTTGTSNWCYPAAILANYGVVNALLSGSTFSPFFGSSTPSHSNWQTRLLGLLRALSHTMEPKI